MACGANDYVSVEPLLIKNGIRDFTGLYHRVRFQSCLRSLMHADGVTEDALIQRGKCGQFTRIRYDLYIIFKCKIDLSTLTTAGRHQAMLDALCDHDVFK